MRSMSKVNTTNGAPQPIAVARLVLDGTLWPRRSLNAERVEEFTSVIRDDGFTPFPPLVVARLDDERFVIADGAHRWSAARVVGLVVLPCIVLDDSSLANVFRVACEASGTSALPLSLTEKRSAVKRWLALDGGISDVELASTLGLSRQTIAKLRKSEQSHSDASSDDEEKEPPDEEQLRLRYAKQLLRAFAKLIEPPGAVVPFTRDNLDWDAAADALFQAAGRLDVRLDELLHVVQDAAEHR
jgi:hypothetical protein